MRNPSFAVIEQGHEDREIMAEVLAAHHDDLAGANIEMAWMLEPKKRNGKTILGTCRIAPELWWRLAGVDIVISLLRPWWQALPPGEAGDKAKRYLVDHELCHAEPRMTDEGEQEMDSTGRPFWRLVAHDLEDFAAPIRRYGPLPDVLAFVEQAQLVLPLNDRGLLRAVS